MLNLLLAVVSSALVSVTMRFSEWKIKNNIAMLAVNYMMCTFLAWAYTGFGSFRPAELGRQTTVIFGAINGVLYLAGFVLLQRNIRTNGVVLSPPSSSWDCWYPWWYLWCSLESGRRSGSGQVSVWQWRLFY